MDDINLLPKKEFENLPVKEKFLSWTVKYGRVIVISFQAIVTALLFYKLHLYNNFSDATEIIEGKIAILQSQNQTEVQIKDVQQRVSALKKAKKDGFSTSGYIEIIERDIPKNIQLTTLIFEKDLIKFTAHSPDLYSFGVLIEQLSEDESVKNVTLLGAQFNKERNEFSLDIEITIKRL
ncbi:hypothetical protein COT69_01940 [candidate division WWE3 bacterium CG09_land_8_20_14_0_10_39_24]|uniref:PilN domain-containing protein n=2 Tax=Katanobacteria TaxID=422282 RepID=A0A2G9XBF9_UNCKA|nr:MAG: hypothetical protein AUJ94_01245 [bacterium CG2_30_40_12]OJI08798.1 MAG: hypothetical protein BK003_01915 [bacterium CG09_39_24]PIP04320.1 MAG: hypothetical protein COX53_03115 [candidate division WWE3 bacterium CG23_combo_of_CG06-09_8_20_14_all_40_14]PIS12826.1 MAG: hypothetical protein COT69_01940 [candidate division WWE3 bacterium CG09_land_8_20_14_0_10_39_24]PJE50612.1 MAG: hypothetical protein COV27_02935 [candidate division WWE3 bacterium CG10_big_fil_rev_8_21_14_0_10_39_14]